MELITPAYGLLLWTVVFALIIIGIVVFLLRKVKKRKKVTKVSNRYKR